MFARPAANAPDSGYRVQSVSGGNNVVPSLMDGD